jgi:hypothetical protein
MFFARMAKTHIQGHKSWYSTDHSMRILLVTPLYPPDISEPAPYVKELAKRLSSVHAVTILTYGHIPEEVSGVNIVSVEKSSILPIRLFRFFWVLRRHAKMNDVIYAQNGPSVEFPLLVLTLVKKVRIILRLGDVVPLRYALTRPSLRFLIQKLMKRVSAVVVHDEHDATISKLLSDNTRVKPTAVPRPLPRPEILPFSQSQVHAMSRYEESWNEHIRTLVTLFTHV